MIKSSNFLKQDFNPRQGLKVDLKPLNKDKKNKESYECTTLFLECLLICNNLEKYNIEIFGNHIETSIFKNFRWGIKANIINDHKNLYEQILSLTNPIFNTIAKMIYTLIITIKLQNQQIKKLCRYLSQ